MYQQSLFDDLVLPDGIDKDVLTNNILLRGGEFEVMYADPHFTRDAIGMWGKKWYRTFEKWIDALSIDYNPLENYDRMEDYSDTLNKGVSTSSSGTTGNTRTFNNEDKETLNTQNKMTHDTTDVTEETVSAYDSSTYQPSRKTTVDNDGTDTMDNTGTDTFNHTGTITDSGTNGSSGTEKENSKSVHEGRIHGNIGVKTSQSMLEEELRIAEWNVYEHITDLFLSEFIIPIYS